MFAAPRTQRFVVSLTTALHRPVTLLSRWQSNGIRYALPSDVTGIEDLFASRQRMNNLISDQLMNRSTTYIAEKVEQQNAVVLEVDNMPSKIVGYCEIEVFDTERDINGLIGKIANQPTYQYQANDVLLYMAGLIRHPHYTSNGTNLLKRVLSFAETQYFQNDQEMRNQWQAPDRVPGSSPPPRRVLVACGTMNPSRGNDFVARELQTGGLFDQQGVVFEKQLSATVEDGSNRPAILHIYHLDRPLTHHQCERTVRNRYLISEQEQRRLLASRVGFVGLSTGSVILEALLREGIGGVYRLADFDSFEMSNANRMLFATKDVGRPKIDLCTERIRSVDKDIEIEAFPNGLSASNVHDFVANCDVIIEECDDFPIKRMIRQAAREARVPVIMATSQNGMIDVERYDCEDYFESPFLPCSSKCDPATNSRGNSAPATPPSALSEYYDMNQFSSRFLVSMSQIKESISSWPQLAEEVFLNAATVAHAARRILLGDQTVVSGRFAIRMDRLFTPENRIAIHQPTTDPLQGQVEFPRKPFAYNLDVGDDVKRLLFVQYWTRTAPSNGNLQPWNTRVIIESGNNPKAELEVSFRPGADPMDKRFNEMTLGCLLENAEIAAAHLKLGLDIGHINLDPPSPTATRIHLLTNSEKIGVIAHKARLFDAMAKGRSNGDSNPWLDKPLPPALLAALTNLGVAVVHDNDESFNAIKRTIVEYHDQFLADPTLRKQLLSHIGPSRFQIHPALFGLSPSQLQNLQLLATRHDAMEFMVQNGFHTVFLRSVETLMVTTKSFFVLCNGNGKDHVQQGRILEQVWLEATHAGVSIQPWDLPSDKLHSIGIPNAFFILTPMEPSTSEL